MYLWQWFIWIDVQFVVVIEYGGQKVGDGFGKGQCDLGEQGYEQVQQIGFQYVDVVYCEYFLYYGGGGDGYCCGVVEDVEVVQCY